MIAKLVGVRQSIVLLWLASALAISGAAPLLGDHEADAARKSKQASASGDLHAEEVRTLANTTPMAITDGPGAGATSSITVSGFETSLADINVTLHTLNHTRSDDIDVLLFGPGGQTAVILSDLGTTNPANNLTVILDDQAANQMPSVAALTNGTFQPTNFNQADIWRPPAPANTPSGSELGVFNSTNPNGTWTLFIQDDTSNGAGGTLNGGWSLRVVSANGVPNAAPDNFQAQAGKQLSGQSVLGNDSDPDDDLLTAILAGQPRQGTVSLLPDGSLIYKSKKKAKGTDSFTYLAQDPGGLSDLETVTIQIQKAKKKKGKK